MRTRKQLADTSGLTVKTLGEIERAERTSYDPATLAVVEQTLKWPAGTIYGIRDDGGSPPVLAPPEGGFTVGRALDALVHPDSDLDERSRQAIRDGMRALLHLGEQAMLAEDARRRGADLTAGELPPPNVRVGARDGVR
jgi:transcriptional regulator with XRE-family HTH domain